MSLLEIKEMLDQSSPEERLFATAYLKHLRRTEDSSYRTEVARKLDQGTFFTLEQARKVHEYLDQQGL